MKYFDIFEVFRNKNEYKKSIFLQTNSWAKIRNI